MSIELIKAVLEDETITNTTARLLLVALANHADKDGVCWPSIERLSKMACISKGQCTRVISKLIQDGHIEADRRGGRNRASVYRLTVQNTRTDARLSCENARTDARVLEYETRAPMQETRAPMRSQSSRTFKESSKNQRGEGREDFSVLEGRGKSNSAQSVDGIAPRLSSEVIAAWDERRWPAGWRGRAH